MQTSQWVSSFSQSEYVRLTQLFRQHHMPEALRELNLLCLLLEETDEREPALENQVLALRRRIDTRVELIYEDQWQLQQIGREEYRRLERQGLLAQDGVCFNDATKPHCAKATKMARKKTKKQKRQKEPPNDASEECGSSEKDV